MITGIDEHVELAISKSPGVVINIGHDEHGYAVTVQYDVRQCLRYMHLKSIDVSLGEIIEKGQQIGTTYKILHFEYITLDPTIHPVRINGVTYYKQNPMFAITNPAIFENLDYDVLNTQTILEDEEYF